MFCLHMVSTNCPCFSYLCMKTNFIVSLDFDGTLVKTSRFPVFDPKPLPFLLESLKWMEENLGAKFILLTQRDHDHYCDSSGRAVKKRVWDTHQSVLQDAIDWCSEVGIELIGINENPYQGDWSTSRKVYSDLIIDDRSLIPLDSDGCVDWKATLKILKSRYAKE